MPYMTVASLEMSDEPQFVVVLVVLHGPVQARHVVPGPLDDVGVCGQLAAYVQLARVLLHVIRRKLGVHVAQLAHHRALAAQRHVGLRLILFRLVERRAALVEVGHREGGYARPRVLDRKSVV